MTWQAKTVPFTKYTDFVGEIRIPGLTPSPVDDQGDIILATENVTGDAAIEELTRLITKYEKRMLVNLLTLPVYDAFVTAMTGSSQPDAKYTELYSKLFDNPIVANYVYYFYQRDIATKSGTIGEVSPTFENATSASAENKVVRAWNENWEYILEFDDWYDDNQSTYEFTRSIDSVYGIWMGYLNQYKPINIFGL